MIRSTTPALFKLLAINLAVGIVAAGLAVAGLVMLDPFGLRRLIAEDQSGTVAAMLLMFGFIVTFGSCAMGTAIMWMAKNAD